MHTVSMDKSIESEAWHNNLDEATELCFPEFCVVRQCCWFPGSFVDTLAVF